ncbi:metallophosphoesterase [Gillisia sp. M10.2A]|uniref:Metallophosphoesterase n=1 Tax=Gillisia lutea TaxID=2909668 RepID=A0ABS9EHB7_9FLAO|nr:metallophosphoesterase [Gillisia lutea]MCF4101145.1 metallophosphoesterase [Gillisia lutea]
MRSYSLFTILILCFAILLVDIIAFYWLSFITQLLTSSILKNIIYALFWIFTFGLITSILILKVRLDTIVPQRKHLLISSLYGLSVSSFIPKLLFVLIISILYYTNYIFSEEVSIITISLLGLLSGFLPFFVIVYGIFRSRYRFKVHHLHIPLKESSHKLRKLKIVQISDLHLGSFNFRYHILDRAIQLINQLQPDLIFFTGDLVNNYAWELKGWEKILGKLKAKHGKYSILGNHDYGDYSHWETTQSKEENFNILKEFHKDTGFKLLLNDAEIVSIQQEKIAIVGVENWGSPPFKQYGDLKEALKNVDSIPLKILLSHDPSHWSEEVVGKTDILLTLSGHTHGMQAGINMRSKEWSPIKYKYKHWAGLYNNEGQYLYVNRGLGWLGFPGRLGMRPEITLIEFE